MTDQMNAAATQLLGAIEVEGLLDLALHMANRADEIALSGFGGGAREESKADGSPVTRIDREIETVLRSTIEREHPRAGVLGEEYGEELGTGRWVIDPIDGTRQFLDGDPRFAVLIAYEIDDVAQIGVVSAPALDLRWWAGAGLGSRYCYRGVVSAARVSVTRRMSKAHGMVLGGHPAGQLLAGDKGPILKHRGVSWEAVRVAGAEFDFALTCGYRWDVAPLPVIIREAGGWARLVASDGGFDHVAVSNSQLADEVDTLL